MQRSFYKVKKDLNIHIYTYISIYLYISVYIYIEKKNEGWAMGMCSFQKNATFCVLLHSFAKERCILCIVLRSLQKNVAFFVFFYVLYKRTLHSLHSYKFLRKKRSVLLGLISRQKLEKKNAKEICVL